MKARILIVEDERHIGTLLKYNCEGEGYEAELVGDGPAAIAFMERDPFPFDLVILDLMLPGMSGYMVLEKLRRANVHIPVLILSARTLSEDRTRGFDAGADQYMTKPFELPELLSRVRGLLARHAQVRGTAPPAPPPTGEVFEFDGAVINFTRHEVTVRNEPKVLTPLELRLLRCFIEHEGVVLTRNELLNQVWGFDSNPTTRTVDNFVARLRQHFEVDPSRPRHFLSVRGVGYRFLLNPAPAAHEEESEVDSDPAAK